MVKKFSVRFQCSILILLVNPLKLSFLLGYEPSPSQSRKSFTWGNFKEFSLLLG